MDDEFRTEKRAEWQERTPLAKRWLIVGVIFVVLVIVIILFAVI